MLDTEDRTESDFHQSGPLSLPSLSWPVTLLDLWKREPILRVHSGSCLILVVAGIFFGFDALRWSIAVLGIVLLFCFELTNTAIERLADASVANRFSLLAKEAKDLAAAAVLSVGAALICAGVLLCLSTPKAQSWLAAANLWP